MYGKFRLQTVPFLGRCASEAEYAGSSDKVKSVRAAMRNKHAKQIRNLKRR